ncbi:MAG TPA: hypothetical protein VMB74_08650 [Streptosporangiaceae bacterium]|nr:hypothetical protein [Streptosporangiaceae bacterium]
MQRLAGQVTVVSGATEVPGSVLCSARTARRYGLPMMLPARRGLVIFTTFTMGRYEIAVLALAPG